jgi:antitoxin PrlF
MDMVMVLEESTVTAKGQTTVPAAVRNALGIGYGARMRWCVRGHEVVVIPAQAKEHDDPALNGLLRLIERDIASGRNLSGLPRDLVAVMQEAVRDVHVDLDEPLEGEVAL